MNSTLLAILFIVVGLSFAYKCVLATFFGRAHYWEGFLPISVVSPFFIHLPAGKNSLIKIHQAWYIHVILGPVFFLISLVLLASGADMLGLPGAETINYVLTFGRSDVPPAITYDRQTGYRFPIVKRTGDAIYKIFTTPVAGEEPKANAEKKE